MFVLAKLGLKGSFDLVPECTWPGLVLFSRSVLTGLKR